MRITLLILVFNNEAFIERTLLSILNNNTTLFDVVINDDNSTDSSVYIIEKFLKEYKEKTKKWRLNLNKVNLGINSSIKNILEKDKNDWVKMLAGDDEFEQGSLDEYYRLAGVNNPYSSIVLSDMSLINEDSEFISKRKSLDPYFYENNLLKTANFYLNTINAPTVMIGRKNLLLALEKSKVKNLEDWPILRFCVSRNFVFNICKKSLIKYRLHQNSLSSSYNSSAFSLKHKDKISDQVEILLNENKLMSKSFFVQFGIYLQLKILKTDSPLMQLFYKVLKLFNLQFCIFRLLSLLNVMRK